MKKYKSFKSFERLKKAVLSIENMGGLYCQLGKRKFMIINLGNNVPNFALMDEDSKEEATYYADKHDLFYKLQVIFLEQEFEKCILS